MEEGHISERESSEEDVLPGLREFEKGQNDDTLILIQKVNFG